MGGIRLKPKSGFKILVKGTDVELEEIYGRTSFSRALNGKKLMVQCNIYLSEQKFKESEKEVVYVEIIDTEGKKTMIPPVGNYGDVDTPENYDNNDLALSNSFVVEKLSNALELNVGN